MRTQFKCENEHTLTASMKISFFIASEGGAHTGGVKRVKACAHDFIACDRRGSCEENSVSADI
jgi:hypothetical protein